MAYSLNAYEEAVGPAAVSQLRQLAQWLKGARVVHVNSTKVGGGVAEILAWMVDLMNDLGLEASWEVIEGNPDFFHVTKSFHNAIQGTKVPITEGMLRCYEETVAQNAEGLRKTLEKADFVVIHDPQPAPLLGLCPNRKGKWIWRCHIDASRPVHKVWGYLRGHVKDYDASVFSMAGFAHPLPHYQFIVAPSIDPLSDKNCELPAEEIEAALKEHGIPRDQPILTQVSRYDRFKDPVGVIEAFRGLAPEVKATLVLAGGGATDDPEGEAVLQEVHAAVNGDPSIHILLLPGDAHRTINALQRASTLIIQKSTQEGFGLTVTEALWKGKPVIGGNVGGIRLQVHDYHTGFLVNTPEGASLRMRELLSKPDLIDEMGRKAKDFVRENFLLTRHLREYLTMMLALKRGVADRLMAQ